MERLHISKLFVRAHKIIHFASSADWLID